MWIALGCVAVFLICVVSWGTVAMLYMQNWTLAGIGALTLVGMVLLVWCVALVYWAIERFTCRARLWQELEAAESIQNIDEQERLKKRIGEETWARVFGMSLMILLYITLIGMVAPIALLINLWCWLCESQKGRFLSKAM